MVSKKNISILTLDESSFEELYKTYAPKMYRIAYSQINDQDIAGNIVHNVFLSIWERRDTLIIEKPEHFLTHATKLQIIKNFRDAANQKQHLQSSLLGYNEADYSTQHEIYYNDLSDRIQTLINKLPPQCRRVYMMRDQQGLDNSQIAFQLGISLSAVKQHIGNALSFLRANLNDIDSE
ncbi:RNA polymerase sigma factor [uncultured Sphingobacterium sp.]|jgi:RNA polymerase sigma-70 factor (ECF subfamily)|uniref:RNA polymerase sigma factor n=1 Tax=uncultured Sphingobacterium sp. TaxID=182688 RepID=UPI003747843F